MKIITIVGARPQFIKAAVVSRELRKNHIEVLVHTGQHYDANMSDIFFEELDIPTPDYNLGVAGGSHAQMTANMLVKIEEILLKEKPDGVLLYGDTNSTLAGAIATAKLGIPIVHVEAGVRTGSRNNPEELNRIVTDHLATLKLYCTESARPHLEKEGLVEGSYLVGDPMFDAFMHYSNIVGDEQPEDLISFEGEVINVPEQFNYLTCHRQENTDDPEKLANILHALEQLEYPCIYPVHPRNRQTVINLKKEYGFSNIHFVQPVGYLMSVFLVNHCKQIVTDSGGLQREAFFAGKQCVTVFDYIIWPETMIANRNQLAKPDTEEILSKLKKEQVVGNEKPFGDGYSAKKITDIIEKHL